MELPLITLAEELSADTSGFASPVPDWTVKGIRLYPATDGELVSGYAYLRREEEGCSILYFGESGALLCRFDFPGASLPTLHNAASEIIEYNSAIDLTMRTMVGRGSAPQDFILLFSGLMGNPVYIVDSFYNVVAINEEPVYSEISAIWRHLVSDRYLSYDLITDLQRRDALQLRSGDMRAAVVSSEAFPNRYINAPLMANGRLIGHLFVVGYNRIITPGKVALAEQLRRFVQTSFFASLPAGTFLNRGYENFLVHMLIGKVSEPTIIRSQLDALGWDAEGAFLLAAAEAGSRDPAWLESMFKRLEAIDHGKPLLYEGRMLVLFFFHDPPTCRSILSKLELLADREQCPFGLSDVCQDFRQLSHLYEQAKLALSDGGQGQEKKLYPFAETAVSYALRAEKGSPALSLLCDPAVPFLKEYDAGHNTEYCRTLRCYLENERNITVTAAQLHIHRNTLLYRIERLGAMLYADFADPSVRLRLLVSFQLPDGR